MIQVWAGEKRIAIVRGPAHSDDSRKTQIPRRDKNKVPEEAYYNFTISKECYFLHDKENW